MCDRFALAGFDALAPDLYKARWCRITTPMRRQRDELTGFHGRHHPDVRGAAQYLARNGAKVA